MAHAPRPSHRRSEPYRFAEGGSVTAEFAVAVPAVMVVILLPLMMIPGVTAVLNCQEAAAAVAREAALSGTIEDAGRVVRRIAGSGAVADVSVEEGGFDVAVTCPLPSDPWGLFPTTVERHSFAAAVP